MKITITIETDNAAFTDNPGETAAIMTRAANMLNYFSHPCEYPLLDSNGNTVGKFTIEQ
jgi:hypothetical protein